MIILSKEQILNLHSQLINKFGGIDGVREDGLLESALNNAYGVYFGLEKYPTVEEKAARLAYSLTKNHPFLDGNKRIGVLIMLVFLEINKIELIGYSLFATFTPFRSTVLSVRVLPSMV